jgi:hypothetical protein
MVSRMANATYILGEEVDREVLVATLTRLWANALRLPLPPERPTRRRRAQR